MTKTLEEVIDALESDARQMCRLSGITGTAATNVVALARASYLDGWRRGHDCASAKALDIMREAGQGRWPSAPAAVMPRGEYEVSDTEPVPGR